MISPSVIDFKAFNPRQNLPVAVARKRGESNFVAAFQRHFTAEREGQGFGGRHFELAGYGIADFVWMDLASSEPVLIAFEMKMKDWRRGISQAYRYSYFADCSIVVLPVGVANRAEAQIGLFKQLGIGLWSYEPKSQTLEERFTPGTAKARSAVARQKAITRISRKIELRKRRE